MEIEGLKVHGWTSLTRHVKTSRTAPDGTPETKTVTYNKGDPELDAYNAEMKERGEKQYHDMWLREDDTPRNYVMFASTRLGVPKIMQPLGEAFERFYRGMDDEKAVESKLSGLVAQLRGFCVEQGYDPAEFMPRMLEDVYEIARLDNIRGAGVASWYESRPLDLAYTSYKRDSKDSIYYNSDFYFRSEEMKGTLLEMTKSIAAKYGVDASTLDLPTRYEGDDLRRGIYSSYNTLVAEKAFNDTRIGWMLDETMVPPKGLRFFYQGNSNGTNTLVPTLSAPRYDEGRCAFDGLLQVWYGDWSFTGRVPVRMDRAYPISVNMYDAVEMNKPGEIPEEIVPFLKNWDFFSLGWSSEYIASHTRILP